jgi:hypothetical protein
MVMADKDVPYIEKHRIGDKVTFDNSADIESKTPMDLYNLSQSRGVGSLFEHGIVGSLTNTFNSVTSRWTIAEDAFSLNNFVSFVSSLPAGF